jgi:hypothetical protein
MRSFLVEILWMKLARENSQNAKFVVLIGPSRSKRAVEVFAAGRCIDADRSNIEMFSLTVVACKPLPAASIRVPESRD